MDNKLDGNAAAGMLQAIFGFEMTSVRAMCNGCGATNPIGATAAYMSAMGTVVRCPACNAALIRVVQGKGSYWLDMRGVRVLQISQTAWRHSPSRKTEGTARPEAQRRNRPLRGPSSKAGR